MALFGSETPVWRLALFALIPAGLMILRWSYLRWRSFARSMPMQERDWVEPSYRLQHATIDDTKVTIHDLRDFTWRSKHDRDSNWVDATFDVNEIVDVWYVISHFHWFRGVAHTMLTFDFSDGRSITASFEVRRGKGVRYRPLKGIWKAYETQLVIGTEEDLIWFRTHCQNARIRMYRVGASLETYQRTFLLLMERANQLKQAPEWYNSLVKGCLTEIIDLVNHIKPGRIPFTWRGILPGFSTYSAMRWGLIEDWGGFRTTLERARIDLAACAIDDRSAFTSGIRATLPPRMEDNVAHHGGSQ